MLTITQIMFGLFQLKINRQYQFEMLLLNFFIQRYSETLQSENEREFVKRILDAYLIIIKVKHIL